MLCCCYPKFHNRLVCLDERQQTVRLHYRRCFITSLVTAAVSDERTPPLGLSFILFLVKVPAHHSTPSSAALAEGSRADCIQAISPRVYKCLHGSAPVYLTDELCKVADVEACQ